MLWIDGPFKPQGGGRGDHWNVYYANGCPPRAVQTIIDKIDKKPHSLK